MKKNETGSILIILLAIVSVILILLPVLVRLVQRDMTLSVKNAHSTQALYLAESGIERGMWLLKSSTDVFAGILTGQINNDYKFGKTFNDITGGTYRIRMTPFSIEDRKVTVVAEGRDAKSQETRAVKVVFQNESFPSAIMSDSDINLGKTFEVHWGSIMSQTNINLKFDSIGRLFPRKFARGLVNPRDDNDLLPPNTGNDGEWTSGFAVPEIPIVDFISLKKAAWDTPALGNTLNLYGCNGNVAGPDGKQHLWCGRDGAAAPVICDDLLPNAAVYLNYIRSNPCQEIHTENDPATYKDFTGGHDKHLQGLSVLLQALALPTGVNNPNRVWYWDDSVVFTGGLAANNDAIQGSVIVQGNLTNWAGDSLILPNVHVPSNAHKEYVHIDNSTLLQYPADAGNHISAPTFNLGDAEGSGTAAWIGGESKKNTDVGFDGFIYVRGNVNWYVESDIHGVLWVEGVLTDLSSSERANLFYDDRLNVPVLNVVLIRNSWEEIPPSTEPWLAP